MKWTFLCLAAALLLLGGGCSKQTGVTDKLDQSTVRVGIMATKWPKSVTPHSDFNVSILVRNVGDMPLPSLGKDGDLLRVGVGYHWKALDEKILVWDGTFTPLPADLAVGKTQELNIVVKAPPAAGRYILEIDMLQNSAFWFAGAGSQVARAVIDVK